MIISHKYKFIFIHIPKTGGTSIKRTLEPFLGTNDLRGVDNHDSPLHHHRTALEIKKFVGEGVWNSYYKFAFVRNPWDLMVSNYHYFKNTKALKNIVPEWEKIRDRDYKSFQGFIDTRGPKDFLLQSRFIENEKEEIIVDFVGRLENMEEDFDKICKKIRLDGVKISHHNKSNHENYVSYYDSKLEEKIKHTFKKDIDNFEYTFDKRPENYLNTSGIFLLRQKLSEISRKVSPAYPHKPKVSIITSVFNGDAYINNFLTNITKQTIFSDCELILINPNSPGKEEATILEFMKKYPNIIYKKLKNDPGLYECWNMAIKMSKGDYITNANLDDSRAPEHIEKLLAEFEKDPELDLACSEILVTKNPFESWEKNSAKITWFMDKKEYFGIIDMFQFNNKIAPCNIPHCMPLWKKNIHNRFGFFNEKSYSSIADYEFWLRCLKHGAKFKLIKKTLGLYLLNSNSYGQADKRRALLEKTVISQYYEGLKSGANDGKYPSKINIERALGKNYGAHHRSGWNYAMFQLRKLHKEGGILLEGFIEKKFAWGSDYGDKKNNHTAHEEPWIGFIHTPPNIPKYYRYDGQHFEDISKLNTWRESLKSCKGIFCLSQYHKNYLEKHLNVPIEALIHPTETPELKFEFDNFIANQDKKIVQVGFWLRKLNSIYFLKPKRLIKAMLKTRRDNLLLDRAEQEKISLGLKIDKSEVKLVEYLTNDEYDELFSKNIAFMDLYDSSANNAIVECIVRNTPLLINPLPAVVEYLGEDYPFYFSSLEEASKKADDFDLINETFIYLKNKDKTKFSGDYFLKSVAESKIYKSL